MSDPNGSQPQGGDQQNNGVSGAAQAPQYTQPAQNYAAPQYTQSQGGYNGQYQDPNAYAQQNYTYAQPPAAYPTYLPRNKYVAAGGDGTTCSSASSACITSTWATPAKAWHRCSSRC